MTEPDEKQYLLTEALRTIFPKAPTSKLANLYAKIYHARRYKPFIQSEQNGKRRRHYISGQDFEGFKQTILEEHSPFGETLSPDAVTPSERAAEENPSPAETARTTGPSRSVDDHDIITLHGLAQLLGISKEAVEKRGISLQKAGTTRYTSVKEVSPFLTDEQRSRLAEYVQ